MIIRQLYRDEYLTSMLPAIDEVILGKFDQFPPQYTDYFRVKSSDRSIEQITEVTGLSTFVETPENSGIIYDRPLPVYNKTFIHLQYGLGYKASKIAVDDDKFAMIAGLGEQLGMSARESREVFAALVFNTGFTTNGPDGFPLFSASHTLAGGGVQSNILPYASDPDVISIQLVLSTMRQTVDHRGKKRRLNPKYLIVHPNNEFVVSEIMNSQDRPDTANRAINSLKQRLGGFASLQPRVWDYLTDPHAWFVMTDPADTTITWYDREKFNTVHGIDFETRAVKTAGWMRYSAGYQNPWGVFGVPSS